MPARSAKQYRLMAMCAHNPKHKSCKGISQKVAQEFIDATPAEQRKKWSKKPRKRR